MNGLLFEYEQMRKDIRFEITDIINTKGDSQLKNVFENYNQRKLYTDG